jgi:hypothetical protein
MPIDNNLVSSGNCHDWGHTAPRENHGHCGRCHWELPLTSFPKKELDADPPKLSNCAHCLKEIADDEREQLGFSRGRRHSPPQPAVDPGSANRDYDRVESRIRGASFEVRAGQGRQVARTAIEGLVVVVQVDRKPGVVQGDRIRFEIQDRRAIGVAFDRPGGGSYPSTKEHVVWYFDKMANVTPEERNSSTLRVV